MKQEIEMALRLLEKDIHEKQDSLIAVRGQLEDVKTINLQMYSKLEVRKMEFVQLSDSLTICILTDIPIQRKAVRMGLSISYFKWSQVNISQL